MINSNASDFTEEQYILYLKEILAKGYIFSDYFSYKNKNTCIIFRHDIDASVHRAYKLAKIEAELGIKSTFFIMLYNWFYDIRDQEVYKLIYAIKELGHQIGLHFDASYLLNTKIIDRKVLKKSLLQQKVELEKILAFEIKLFSYHNPTILGNNLIKDLEICGMLNVYNEIFIKNFKYCSDSNGLWRFEKLDDLINPKLYPKLHILTHPEWWTPESLTPRQKILRALNGRLSATLTQYDRFILENNRLNIV
ncbi:MAG: hypothetical protein O7C59_01555 [Rickettsia endosymbiont of Ixodes persulcatus]|nr:hypothetical protein [Rickettsia endosymbiont of Ixodes persulcatus]